MNILPLKQNASRVLHGDRQKYPFDVLVIGDDLVVQNARATWFGGPNDPGDNGVGASGFSTKLHPSFIGCALPMQGWKMCPGTPLPHLPWFTVVEVQLADGSDGCEAQLIDVGPSPLPIASAQIDLTPAAFKALGVPLRNNRPARGSLEVVYRIKNGAKHLAA